MMSDDRGSMDYHDRSRIDQSQKHERDYWTGKWNITEEQLSKAIKGAESIMVEDVARWLKEIGKIDG